MINHFTPEMAKSLKKRYDKAIKERETQFTWKNHELLTSYAKYLLEYLKPLLKTK